MFGLTDKKCGTYWKDGPRVWKLEDICILAEEPYFHLELVQGKHPFADHWVVDEYWFEGKIEVKSARVGFKVVRGEQHLGADFT